MNKNQRTILKVGGVIIVLMLLFPPWQQPGSGGPISRGYGFVFDTSPLLVIDISRLLVQSCAVGLATAIAFFMAKKGDGN